MLLYINQFSSFSLTSVTGPLGFPGALSLFAHPAVRTFSLRRSATLWYCRGVVS
jgi:hypothetical protein